MRQFFETDVAVIGGGLGGAAAALTAAEAGLNVILSEVTGWIGGQVTSQAVSALDEHRYIEAFGGTRSYYRFREGVRAYYRRAYPQASSEAAQNPGDSWVSRLCFEPRVGLAVLQEMLAPYVASGRLKILLNHAPVSAVVTGNRLREVVLSGPGGQETVVQAAYYLDATELGDLLPLAGVPYASGAEAVEDTGEPHASKDGPQPERVQSFTQCFLLEHRPGEDHTIPRPAGYESFRDSQPFSLILRMRGGGRKRFYMFEGDLPFWTYRRVFSSALLDPARSDIALINWDSNDYYTENIIDRSPEEQARILYNAKQLSLSFLYWLQVEVPRDDDQGFGYPGLRLLTDALGTTDGTAQYAYIREARRILGLHRVLEQDMIAGPDSGARAAFYPDTVGVGWYPIDLHRCAGDPDRGRETRIDFDDSLPFQIPLGALFSAQVENLIAAAKNLATTHITNGAYRLHPVEWNVGESAGALAAFCLAENTHPRAVLDSPTRLRDFQRRLLALGVPLSWAPDVPLEDSAFGAVQEMMLAGPFPAGSRRFADLMLRPDEPLAKLEAAHLLGHLPGAADSPSARRLAEGWQADSHSLLSGEDWRAALDAVGRPPQGLSDYPTLRQVAAG
jgi:hypothetical protein